MARGLWAGLRTTARWLAIALAVVLVLSAGAAIWGVWRVDVERPPRPALVYDVTRLDPVPVARVITPTTTEEIVAALRTHPGPIAIGGARHSMGGQTATEGALHIDMRRFNRILGFSRPAKVITVQAGTTWRQIQEHIDTAGLAVKIMQTYADFTVGGSLSVNAHGRYVGLGPLILSVKSLKVVLADGSLVEASPTRNRDLFYGVIGGYGGLGVITEVTLELVDNVRVKRRDRTMPVAEYKRWFFDVVRDSASAVFHNADLYPDAYATVNAVTYSTTADSVTVADRLIPADRSYGLHRFVFWLISEWPFGKAIRRRVIDPLVFRGEPVTWRNYEASYDVRELEPGSRAASTYALQEYFVPVERFDDFVPLLRDVLRRHRVNVINVSIRHAKRDPGSLLAWARSEVFAFVIYYKQGVTERARAAVGDWTRELVDAVLGVGGTYYLPYQLHATEEQFRRAYPRAAEFFTLKRRVDPTNKFRNRLWDKYDRSRPGAADRAELPAALRERLAARSGYGRDEGQTFLTHPEWYIVYNSDEYAAWLADSLPSTFPYVLSIGQYWANYREARALTRREYPLNWGYHVMLLVIGTSYTAELTLKGLYQNTVGRFTAWTSRGALTDEDRYAHTVAADYGRFIHVRPWYEYRFAPRLRGVWTSVPLFGRHPLRKLERKLFLTVEYGVKAVYATLIQVATRTAYGSQTDRMEMVVTGWSEALARRVPNVTELERLDETRTLVAAPRYDAFRDAMLDLARSGAPVQIVEIAGNDEIFLTGVASADWTWSGGAAAVVYSLRLPTDRSRKRVALAVPVPSLLTVLRRLETEGRMAVDHVYDY